MLLEDVLGEAFLWHIPIFLSLDAQRRQFLPPAWKKMAARFPRPWEVCLVQNLKFH